MSLSELLNQSTLVMLICRDVKTYDLLTRLCKEIRELIGNDKIDFDFFYWERNNGYEKGNNLSFFETYRKGLLHSRDDKPCRRAYTIVSKKNLVRLILPENAKGAVSFYEESIPIRVFMGVLANDNDFVINIGYEWRDKGVLHRENGPAIIEEEPISRSFYFKQGSLCENDEPDVTSKNFVGWLKRDENCYYFHREDGPAIIKLLEKNFFVKFMNFGKEHRLGLPSSYYSEDMDGEIYSKYNNLKYKRCGAFLKSVYINEHVIVEANTRFKLTRELNGSTLSVEKVFNNGKRKESILRMFINKLIYYSTCDGIIYSKSELLGDFSNLELNKMMKPKEVFQNAHIYAVE